MLLPRFIGTGGFFPGLYLRPHSRLFIPGQISESVPIQ
jgi:hypothetical protein